MPGEPVLNQRPQPSTGEGCLQPSRHRSPVEQTPEVSTECPNLVFEQSECCCLYIRLGEVC